MLDGYIDTNMASDVDSRKSTSGYMITFIGGAISWQSKLKKCVAFSTIEIEYITIPEVGKELLWMQNLLQELGLNQEKYVLHCDDQSAIHLNKNSTFHSRSKHIEVWYHWIREVLEMKQFSLEKNHREDLTHDDKDLTHGEV